MKNTDAGRIKYIVASFTGSLAVTLIALVDMRRAFITTDYILESSWISISYVNILMLMAGVVGMILIYRFLRIYEPSVGDAKLLSRYTKLQALLIAMILVIDLTTLYRGIAATRIAASGVMAIRGEGLLATTSVGLIAIDTMAPFLRPVASALNYLAAVWHAIFLGILLASLFLTALAEYAKPAWAFGSRFRSTLLGTMVAIPQPFCSCCASPIAATIYRRGAPLSSALSFLMASPMLNITTLILAMVLLPPEFALLRIAAGLLLAVPLSYALSPILERTIHISREGGESRSKLIKILTMLLNRYCNLFHLEQIARARASQTPSSLITIWLRTALRIAKLLLPIFIIGAVATAAVAHSLQTGIANSPIGVLTASMAGTLLMISTWTELPVAGLLIEVGLRGPAAALLVTLPAVSLPCLLIFGGALGSLRASLLLGLMVFLLGLAAGLIFL